MTIKVRELILALQTFPQEMEVMVQDRNSEIILHEINSALQDRVMIHLNGEQPSEHVVVLTTEKL